jgi:hypothetical protein
MTDAENKEAGITILHYGMLAAVVINLIMTALLLIAVRSNQKITITAEAFARIAAEDRVTDAELKDMLDLRDEQIEELRKRIEATEPES